MLEQQFHNLCLPHEGSRMHRSPPGLIGSVEFGTVINQLSGHVDVPQHCRNRQQRCTRPRIDQRWQRPLGLVFLRQQCLHLRTIPTLHGVGQETQPLRRPRGSAVLLGHHLATASRHPFTSRQDRDKPEHAGHKHPEKPLSQHRHEPPPLPQHGREEAAHQKEQRHPKPVDYPYHEPCRERLLRVLHNPRKRHECHGRMQHNPQQHCKRPQGIEIMAATARGSVGDSPGGIHGTFHTRKNVNAGSS